MAIRIRSPLPSSQRTLGSILTFSSLQEAKFKLDPSVRWDDEPKANAWMAGHNQTFADVLPLNIESHLPRTLDIQ